MTALRLQAKQEQIKDKSASVASTHHFILGGTWSQLRYLNTKRKWSKSISSCH